MKKNLVLTSVVVIAAASLSGCNFGESNHLLGNWKLESISVSSNAPAEYAKVAALLSCVFWTIVGSDSERWWAVILIDRGH